MLFMIYVNPHENVNRLALYKEFEKMSTKDKNLSAAVVIERTVKVVGRDEVYLLVRAENLIFLEQALGPFQSRADIEVTPVVELE